MRFSRTATAAITLGSRTEGHDFVLLLAVDDATGAAVHALSRPAEDTRGYVPTEERRTRPQG